MQNLTHHPDNATSQRSLSVTIKVCVVVPFFCIFLFCIVVMLHIFATHRQLQDSSRYILFAYMLVNDTIQLLTSVLLFLFAMGRLEFAIVYCAPLLFFATATFQNTSLILATMSLERYVAICYPLRCPAAWRSDRIWVIMLAIWLISCILPLVDFSLGEPAPGVDVLTTPVYCKTSFLNALPVQTLFKVSLSGLFFTVVAAIIMFTYIKILLEMRKMRQDKASVGKAMHTVLLHGFQLLLCTLAFTHPITESLIVLHAPEEMVHLEFFNYFCFIIVPRFLSPLIYGLRDESFRGHMRKAVLCCSHRVSPRATGKPQVK